ncbi:MAG: hypothetical protein AB2A00_23995 [Myxococcota bacterium]
MGGLVARVVGALVAGLLVGCVGNKPISQDALKNIKSAAVVSLMAPIAPRYNNDRSSLTTGVGVDLGWRVGGLKNEHVRGALDAFLEELTSAPSSVKWLSQKQVANHKAYRALKPNPPQVDIINPTGLDRLIPFTPKGNGGLARDLDVDMVVVVKFHYYIVYMDSQFALGKQDHSLRTEMDVTGYSRDGAVIWNEQHIYAETDELYHGRGGKPDDFSVYAAVMEDLFRNGGKTVAKRLKPRSSDATKAKAKKKKAKKEADDE